MTADIRTRYLAAPTFTEYLETVEKNDTLWHAIHDRVKVPESLIESATSLPGRWHLLAISEDWCGDAVNLLPPIARWAEELPNVDFRVLGRDDNLDIMDAHLTNGRSRSIPIVILYDGDFEEVGWWGPRPDALQQWVMEEGMELDSDERYKHIRRWYARDRGVTAIAELLERLNTAA